MNKAPVLAVSGRSTGALIPVQRLTVGGHSTAAVVGRPNHGLRGRSPWPESRLSAAFASSTKLRSVGTGMS